MNKGQIIKFSSVVTDDTRKSCEIPRENCFILYTLKKQRMKVTQLENVHFIKVNELN